MPVIDALASLGVHRDEPARIGLGAGVRTGWGDDWLQLGPVKVFTDGSILGRTAQLSEPYEGRPGYCGYLPEDEEERKGRLVAGQLADRVMLEEHPADVAMEEIGSIPVLATVVGGVFTHRQDGL